jgi:hypothetical protein
MDPNQTAQQNPYVPVDPQNDQNQATGSYYSNKPGQMGGIDMVVEQVTSLQQPEVQPVIHRSFETAPKAPEIIRPLESLPSQEIQTLEPTAPQQSTQPSPTPIQTPAKGGVVDQTKIVTKLHHLDTTSDAITSLADEEEEKFIQEVEAAHGVK